MVYRRGRGAAAIRSAPLLVVQRPRGVGAIAGLAGAAITRALRSLDVNRSANLLCGARGVGVPLADVMGCVRLAHLVVRGILGSGWHALSELFEVVFCHCS